MKDSKQLEQEGLDIIKNIQERIESQESQKDEDNLSYSGKFIISAGIQFLKNRSKKLLRQGKKDHIKELAKFIVDTKNTMNRIYDEDKKSKPEKKVNKKSKLYKNNNYKRKSKYSRYNYFSNEMYSNKFKMWSQSDKKNKVEDFYVYILHLKNNEYYVGHTKSVGARMIEHRNGEVKTTKGLDPVLVYFVQLRTRQDATKLENDLKFICKQNPRKIKEMILKFKHNIDEINK